MVHLALAFTMQILLCWCPSLCPCCLRIKYCQGCLSHAQAVKRLQETLDWRQEADVEHITCTACLADPRSHYMHPVGFDRLGRPVLYSCLQLAANRSVEDNRRHMIATFEQVGKA